MSDPTLDPDLEQVLEDIAADPRSKLFLTDPRKVLTGLRDGSLETPASRTGLRPAERHLLEVYRHELAFLLRQVYRVELAKRDTVHVQLTSASEPDLRSRIHRLIATKQRVGAEKHLLAFVDCSPLDAMQILSASLTLEDAPHTVVCLANEYLDKKTHYTSSHLFHRVLKAPRTPVVTYCAWEGLGANQRQTGDAMGSLFSYKNARESALQVSAEDALASTASVLRLALSLDDKALAETTTRWIDDNFRYGGSVFSEVVRAFKTTDRICSRDGSNLVQTLLDTSASPANEVINAITG